MFRSCTIFWPPQGRLGQKHKTIGCFIGNKTHSPCGDPPTYPGFERCIKFWTAEPSHWVIHLSSVGQVDAPKKTSFLWVFYGEVFLRTMVKLQKTDDSCVCAKMVVEYCPCMSTLYGRLLCYGIPPGEVGIIQKQLGTAGCSDLSMSLNQHRPLGQAFGRARTGIDGLNCLFKRFFRFLDKRW